MIARSRFCLGLATGTFVTFVICMLVLNDNNLLSGVGPHSLPGGSYIDRHIDHHNIEVDGEKLHNGKLAELSPSINASKIFELILQHNHSREGSDDNNMIDLLFSVM